MRIVNLIILAISLSSCSVFILPDRDETGDARGKPSSRRADHAKYIIESENAVGSRKLFLQPGGKNCLNSSKAVSAYLETNLLNRNQDLYLIILLDHNNEVIRMEALDETSHHTLASFTPAIIDRALASQAASVILVQSQPTRSSNPYKRDREISKQLQSVLEAAQINFLDHIIVGKKGCFSFADHRLL